MQNPKLAAQNTKPCSWTGLRVLCIGCNKIALPGINRDYHRTGYYRKAEFAQDKGHFA
jgi:hypothetical protein